MESHPSRFEDRTEDSESSLADLDRVLLHRMICRTHLLHLQIPDELPPSLVQAEQHNPIDEEALVTEELDLPIRASFHDDEGGELIVSEHLEEVEHPLAHVRRVLHQRVQRPERIQGEDLELVSVDLAIVDDHPLDEGEVVRLVLRADDRVDLPQVGEVADLHVHGKIDANRFHG